MEFLQQLGKKLGKNWHIPSNISATFGPIFTKLSVLVAMYRGVDPYGTGGHVPHNIYEGGRHLW